MLAVTSALVGRNLDQHVAVVTDGRFSGASHGILVGHVCPEAYRGGPIARIASGDEVVIDLDAGKLDYFPSAGGTATALHVREEVASDQPGNFIPHVKMVQSGLLQRYRDCVGSAATGAVLQAGAGGAVLQAARTVASGPLDDVKQIVEDGGRRKNGPIVVGDSSAVKNTMVVSSSPAPSPINKQPRRFKVLQDEALPPAQQALISSRCDVVFFPQIQNLADAKERFAEVEGVFWAGHGRVPIEDLPRLRVISNEGTGYDFIDTPACLQREIALGHTPGVGGGPTAELGLGLLLAVCRGMKEGEQRARRSTSAEITPRPITPTFGYTKETHPHSVGSWLRDVWSRRLLVVCRGGVSHSQLSSRRRDLRLLVEGSRGGRGCGHA